MSKSIKAAPKQSKIQLRKKIALTLKKTFSDLEQKVGEKKFRKHIEKASKILAAGVIKKPTAGKKALPKKK